MRLSTLPFLHSPIKFTDLHIISSTPPPPFDVIFSSFVVAEGGGVGLGNFFPTNSEKKINK
jgi:hypothetical protein